jgi:hypothetical protein
MEVKIAFFFYALDESAATFLLKKSLNSFLVRKESVILKIKALSAALRFKKSLGYVNEFYYLFYFIINILNDKLALLHIPYSCKL